MTTDKKLIQRAHLFDECYDSLSEKARHDLDYRLFTLTGNIDGIGDLGARELLLQLARFVEKTEAEHERATKANPRLSLSDMSTEQNQLPRVWVDGI